MRPKRSKVLAIAGYFFLLILTVLVVQLFFLSPVAAQCTNYENYLHWIESVELIGNPIDIEVQGSFAYILADGPTVYFYVIDISDPGNATIEGSWPVTSTYEPTAMAVSGSYAAVLVGNGVVYNYFYILSIEDPNNPHYLDRTQIFHNPDDIGLYNSTVIVVNAHDHNELRVYPLFGDPYTYGELQSNFYPTSVVIAGDLAYVASSAGSAYQRGLFVVDISDRTDLHFVGQYIDNSLNPSAIAVHGNLAFLACRNLGLKIFDISDPTSPQYAGTWDLASCADDVSAEGDYCYLTCSDEGTTYVIDVSNPAAPVEVGGITPFGRCIGVRVAGSHLYMAIEDTGMDIVAVATPGGLDPISAENTPGTAEDVVFSNARANLLYVADGAAGVQVINVDDPLDPELIGNVETPGYATDLALTGNHVFVADADSGLQVVDISVPDTPILVADINTLGMAVDLEISGSLAYVAVVENGMRIVDISTPITPTVRGSNNDLSAVHGITVSGNYAYVADGIEGLKILDVSDPDDPWIIGGVKARTMTEAVEVAVSGVRAFVADADSNLFIIDVTNPENPQVLGELHTSDQVRDLNVTGDHAYLANSGSGMQLIDVQDSASPFIVGNVDVPSTSRGVFVTEDFVFVAADTAGIMVCPSQCGAYERVTADYFTDVTAAFLPATVYFTDQSLGYIINYDWDFGDGIGHSNEVNPTYSFTEHGEYNVMLTVTGLATTDSLTTVIYVLSEPPLITDVDDVPNDQGGSVYVNFARSGYDDTNPSRSEIYSIQRQDDGQWVTVATAGAYGELYYSVLAQTQGDGAENWTTPFRVIAHMDEGIWIGPTTTGFSEDNIAPEAPANVTWMGVSLLGWDPVSASDFAYYKIYGGPSSDFAEAVPFDATIETQIDLNGVAYNWVFVVAVDDADLESPPSTPTDVADVPIAVTEVQLSAAIPNPFNPSTTIKYALPKAAHVHLAIYDISGRQVNILVDDVMNSGHHQSVWQGDDRTGQPVSSGTYFSRLVADGKVLTDRMMLLK